MEQVYKPTYLEPAVNQLQQEVDELKAMTSASEWTRLKTLFTTYKKCLFVGCMLQAWQQLMGINTAMYYGPDIMLTAGITIPGMNEDESAILLNIPLAFVNAMGNLTQTFVIDKFGRRYIMLRAVPFCILGWTITATGMYLIGYTEFEYGAYIAIAGIIMFLAAFSFGFSAQPWAVNTEIYPLTVIGTAQSLSTTSNWVANFIVASTFLILLESTLGSVLSFVILAFFSCCAWLFTYCLLPETANRTIEENLEAILGQSYVEKQRLLKEVNQNPFESSQTD